MLTQERFMTLPAWSRGYIAAIFDSSFRNGMPDGGIERERYEKGWNLALDDMTPTKAELRGRASNFLIIDEAAEKPPKYDTDTAPYDVESLLKKSNAEVTEFMDVVKRRAGQEVMTYIGEDPAAGSDVPCFAGTAKDWRLGLTVKPKLKNDPLYQLTGEVIDVLPNLLKIRMQTGAIVVRPADEWVTFGHGKD